MPIAFSCARCGKRFEVGDALAGRPCRCKRCGHVFAIPEARVRKPEVLRPARRPAAVSSPQPAALVAPSPVSAGVLSFDCEWCGKHFHLDARLAGRRGRCKDCGLVFIIPGLRPLEGSGSYVPRRGGDEEPTVRRPRPRPEVHAVSSAPAPAVSDEDLPPALPPRQIASAEVDERPRPPVRARSGARGPKGKSSARKSSTGELPAWAYLVGILVGIGSVCGDTRPLPHDLSGGVIVFGSVLFGIGVVCLFGRLFAQRGTYGTALALVVGGGALVGNSHYFGVGRRARGPEWYQEGAPRDAGPAPIAPVAPRRSPAADAYEPVVPGPRGASGPFRHVGPRFGPSGRP